MLSRFRSQHEFARQAKDNLLGYARYFVDRVTPPLNELFHDMLNENFPAPRRQP